MKPKEGALGKRYVYSWRLSQFAAILKGKSGRYIPKALSFPSPPEVSH